MTTSLEALRNMVLPAETTVAAAALLTRVRDAGPRVHCLTSPVAAGPSANALLAVGAVPSLSADAATVAEFVRGADALVVNLGMMDAAKAAAIDAATEAARASGRPWLLDPVMVERSESRARHAHDLLARRPAVVRGNAGEIATLALGADDPPADLARSWRCAVARTGREDVVTDGEATLRIANGSALMDRVTALGCAVSAVAGAFLAVAERPYDAAVAALLVAGIAGELAEARAHGPGSFAVAWLDALHAITADDVVRRSRVS